MNGRERVKAALTFSYPDRVPRDLWTLPYIPYARKNDLDAILTEFPMDFSSAGAIYPEDLPRMPTTPLPGYYRDEWGSGWLVAEAGVVGEVKEPALPDWSRLTRFKPPYAVLRQRDLSQVDLTCANSERFILSECTARLFERMQFLRGSQSLFFDLAYGPAELLRLLELVHEYYLEDIRGWCATAVDAITFMDDWGTNHHLLINPRTWRELFKPRYKEYVDLAHQAGKFIFFHSDGCIEALYGDLVEIGIDAVNSQLFTMNIEELGRLYRGKITFWGEIDRQHTLPFGAPDEVRRAVQRVRAALDTGRGGVIAQCEFGKLDPRDNIASVYRTWLE